MKLSDKVSIPPQVMVRQVGTETVILDLASGGYFGLDEVGARCWQLLSEGLSLGECCDRILDEYDAQRDQVESDILLLVEQLAARELVAPF